MYLYSVFESVQGEGIEIGKPTIFVRFAGCPFRCKFCDEPAAISIDGGTQIEVTSVLEVIVDTIKKFNITNIEFTGGSPEMQKKDLFFLAKELRAYAAQNDTVFNLSLQSSGAYKLGKEYFDLFDSVKIDYKPIDIGMPFETPLTYFRKSDEVKILVDFEKEQPFKNLNDFTKLIKDIDFNSNIVLTTTDYPTVKCNSVENWRKLTEMIVDLKFPIKVKSKIQVLPRLQVLYWNNIKDK